MGLDIVQYGEKWEHRSDLTGVHFHTATLDTQPFVTVRDIDPHNLPPGYNVSKLHRVSHLKTFIRSEPTLPTRLPLWSG